MIEGRAEFSVIGRIYDVMQTKQASNGQPMLRLKILKKTDSYVTVILFGDLVTKYNNLVPEALVKGNKDNPFVWIRGNVNENKYQKNDRFVSEVALIGSDIIIPTMMTKTLKDDKEVLAELLAEDEVKF